MSGAHTPFTRWLASAQPGDRFIVAGMTDAHIVGYLRRYGRQMRAERAVLLTGSTSAPAAEPVVIVTAIDAPDSKR